MEAAQVVGQDFINIAFGLKQGEVSRLMEGRIGYQIIKITEKYDQKNLELDDIFQLGTRMTVRDYIGNVLLQERQAEAYTKATEELVAELRAGKTFQVFERNLIR
jgi:parvulin-like peptidyl-prolyl isomerase